jgi:hypothetical protein
MSTLTGPAFWRMEHWQAVADFAHFVKLMRTPHARRQPPKSRLSWLLLTSPYAGTRGSMYFVMTGSARGAFNAFVRDIKAKI